MARLAFEILNELEKDPRGFFARAYVAPSLWRDKNSFSHPGKRIRFYIKKFAEVILANVPSKARLIISTGTQGGDPDFQNNLQAWSEKRSRDEGYPQVIVTENDMRNCLLLQTADLVTGCVRVLEMRGSPNPNKDQIAQRFEAVFSHKTKRLHVFRHRWPK